MSPGVPACRSGEARPSAVGVAPGEARALGECERDYLHERVYKDGALLFEAGISPAGEAFISAAGELRRSQIEPTDLAARAAFESHLYAQQDALVSQLGAGAAVLGRACALTRTYEPSPAQGDAEIPY